MYLRSSWSKMGINQTDFVKAFVAALSDAQVMKKLKDIISSDIIQKTNENFKKIDNVLQQQSNRIKTLEEKIDKLEAKVNKMEQDSNKSSIRISGLEENEHKSASKTILDVMKDLKVEPAVKMDDISQAFRIGKPNGTSPRPILVKFGSEAVQKRVMSFRKRLRDSNFDPSNSLKATEPIVDKEECPPTSSKTVVSEEENPPLPSYLKKVYFNEQLTREAVHLLFLARTMKKNKKINGCWSFRGDIIIKNLQSQIVKIVKPDDLEQFNN